MKKKRNFGSAPFARVVAPRKVAPAQKTIPLNVLFGLPDDRTATVKIADGGRRLDYTLPGTVDIVQHLSPARFTSEWVYLGPDQDLPVKLRPGVLLNHIGDPDICSQALELARQVVVKTGRACFNHPDAIAGTTRDHVARVLAGIRGLDVPKTIRVAAPTPTELQAAVKREGLEYPILVRVAGAHGGTNMVKIDTPGAAGEMDRLDRSVRSALYVTEFRDFATPNGQYRKFRIAVVGDDIFVRHIVRADNWLIHASRRAANTKDEEFAMFAVFDEEHGKRLRPMFQEIGRRLDLDFFGVDCAIVESGEVLLFEANACMAILGQTQKELNIKAIAINRIRDAVSDRLAAPSTWRRSRPRADTGAAKA